MEKTAQIPRNRHHRERFDPRGDYIWIRHRFDDGKRIVPGDPVDKAALGRNLKATWNVGRIALKPGSPGAIG